MTKRLAFAEFTVPDVPLAEMNESQLIHLKVRWCREAAERELHGVLSTVARRFGVKIDHRYTKYEVTLPDGLYIYSDQYGGYAVARLGGERGKQVATAPADPTRDSTTCIPGPWLDSLVAHYGDATVEEIAENADEAARRRGKLLAELSL